MSKKQRELDEFQMQNSLRPEEPEYDILRKKTIKELIAPSGIDASNIDHLEIISNTTRYARSFLYQTYHVCAHSQSFLGICICLEI